MSREEIVKKLPQDLKPAIDLFPAERTIDGKTVVQMSGWVPGSRQQGLPDSKRGGWGPTKKSPENPQT